MNRRFAGRICVVTGAARGIGLAIAERLGAKRSSPALDVEGATAGAGSR